MLRCGKSLRLRQFSEYGPNSRMNGKTDIYLGNAGGAVAQHQLLALKWANRHGLIAGATGTGKTVTLQVLAEGFAGAGVPVFMADVKGDLSGICMPSAGEDFLQKRAADLQMNAYKPQAFSVSFWDVLGMHGTPLRTTISEIGPLLLARMLELNDTQEGVLTIAFRMADEAGLLLLDLKDLRALLIDMAERAAEISAQYGQVSKPSIAAIQRSLLRLEDQGAAAFLGEPALVLADLMRTDIDGKGIINILDATKLINSPRLYATSLLWLLSELFEELPEAGDTDKPKLVFFFDEAHLLFTDAPKALTEKIEQVVRLIRSKGVGIYFITQNPQDIPDNVLAQLGNRVQHGLRAFTPQQQKFIQKAAQTYPPNPAFKVEAVMSELGVGEALVSVLEGKGTPSMTQRVLIRPPASKLGPASAEAVRMVRMADRMTDKYSQSIDRESAYEILTKKGEKPSVQPTKSPAKPRSSTRQSVGEAAVKSVVRSLSSSLGRRLANEIIRGVLGGRRR